MTMFAVEKALVLSVEIEADTPQEAIDKMLNMDDNEFVVLSCEYIVFGPDAEEPIDEDEWEKPYGS